VKAAAYVPPPDSFDTAQVVKLTGASFRQLQWWDEQSIVTPRHDGHRRIYGAADVMRVLLVTALRRRGLALNRMRQLLKPALLNRLGDDSTGEQFLVGNRKTIQLIPSRGEVIDLLKQARIPLFVLSVPDVLKPLHDALNPPGQTANGKKK
jgi:DNA-binding transcriptional MerR regulator